MPQREQSSYSGAIYSCSKLKLDSLFLRWFSLTESQTLVLNILDDLQAGRRLNEPSCREGKRPVSPCSLHGSTPPLSPHKCSSQNSILTTATLSSEVGSIPRISPLKREAELSIGRDKIPRFYFPQSLQTTKSLQDHLRSKLLDFIRPFGEGLPLVALKAILKDLFGLPVSLAFALHNKLASLSENTLPAMKLVEWLDATDFTSSSSHKRLFEILRSQDRDFLTPEDFRPVILGIIVSHPGLSFLKGASEFQDRYAETVIYRIFYSLSSTGTKRLCFRDVRRGKLLEELYEVESDEDVNTCTKFFSYEHFYVIYCKFWDLDTDHDFLLSRDDLLRYSNHSLTYRIADRLFAGAARSLSSGVPNRMGYEDFVWFILSEEDKSTDSSLEYWFRACDLNGDERLTQDELLWFYEEQISRMECLSQETVTFDDVMSQMLDMFNPENPFYFTMRDLKRNRSQAGILFNVMFNLSKFFAFEMRDPFTIRHERDAAARGGSEWDRFARIEYGRLANEDPEEVDDGSMMPWSQNMESEF